MKKIMKKLIIILILICVCELSTGCLYWNFDNTNNTNEMIIIPNQADNELLDAIIFLIDKNPEQTDAELLNRIILLIIANEDWWLNNQLLNLIIENDIDNELVDQIISIINENKNWTHVSLFDAVVLLINENNITQDNYFDCGAGIISIIVGTINENKLFNTLVNPKETE